ncbi:MAG: response regulator [Bryobacteraceae bacterium]|nr:response regulator [Bryobacteraceae bacterium]
MKIFLAEDNPADVYLLREALGADADSQIELMVVQDGEEALDFVNKRGKYASVPNPDLIVLDLNLPKSDGTDVLKSIRESDEFHDIPVVILTSSDSPRDRAAAEELGADGYITKPSDLDAFLLLGDRLRAFVSCGPRRAAGA